MKINYTYLGIGILILGAGFYLLNKSKSNATPSQDSVKLDDVTLNTFIKYLYDRGYSVEQLPEDLKKELTTEQMDKIREALKNYKP